MINSVLSDLRYWLNSKLLVFSEGMTKLLKIYLCIFFYVTEDCFLFFKRMKTNQIITITTIFYVVSINKADNFFIARNVILLYLESLK